MVDVPKGRYMQEGVPSTPAPSRNKSPTPLNAQHLPQSIFHPIFQAAVFVSYIPNEVPRPLGPVTVSLVGSHVRFVVWLLAGWQTRLLRFSSKCPTPSRWGDVAGRVLVECTDARAATVGLLPIEKGCWWGW